MSALLLGRSYPATRARGPGRHTPHSPRADTPPWLLFARRPLLFLSTEREARVKAPSRSPPDVVGRGTIRAGHAVMTSRSLTSELRPRDSPRTVLTSKVPDRLCDPGLHVWMIQRTQARGSHTVPPGLRVEWSDPAWSDGNQAPAGNGGPPTPTRRFPRHRLAVLPAQRMGPTDGGRCSVSRQLGWITNRARRGAKVRASLSALTSHDPNARCRPHSHRSSPALPSSRGTPPETADLAERPQRTYPSLSFSLSASRVSRSLPSTCC